MTPSEFTATVRPKKIKGEITNMPNDLSISIDELSTGVKVKKRWNEKVSKSKLILDRRKAKKEELEYMQEDIRMKLARALSTKI